MSSDERQRFQNHLQIQLHQITQNESNDAMQRQSPKIIQTVDQPVKSQKSFLDGDLDFVSLILKLFFTTYVLKYGVFAYVLFCKITNHILIIY